MANIIDLSSGISSSNSVVDTSSIVSGGTVVVSTQEEVYSFLEVSIPIIEIPELYPVPEVFIKGTYGLDGDFGYGVAPYGEDYVTKLQNVKCSYPSETKLHLVLEDIYDGDYLLTKVNSKLFKLTSANSDVEITIVFR